VAEGDSTLQDIDEFNQATSWSVVCTSAEPRLLAEAFAAHHIAAGAERVFMFLDDPFDIVAETLNNHPKVTAIVCDAKYWSARTNGRPDDHRHRQTYNAEIAARRLCTSEWIAHLDTDEFLHAQGRMTIADILDRVPEDLDAARFLPAERMFIDNYVDGALDFAGVFKLAPRTWLKWGRELYGPELGMLFPNGFQGHVEGKSFRRTRRRDLHLNIHFVRKEGEEVPHHTVDQSDGVLLHFFPASYDDWKRKFERRLLNKAYFADMPDRYKTQYSSYLQALEKGGEDALRELFQRLSVVTAERSNQLVSEGAAIRPNIDLKGNASAAFKPLRPWRFADVKRGRRRPATERVFQIGMNRAGSKEIALHFGARGFSYAHWDKGKLAREVLHAKKKGERPFSNYEGINLLSDMAVNTLQLCYDSAFDVAFIAEHYPNAIYLLNHRPVEEWIESRSRFRGGEYLAEQRTFFKLPSNEDVIRKWRHDWAAHIQIVNELRLNGLQILEWNINTEKPHLFFQRLDVAFGVAAGKPQVDPTE
jgi:hypothetical protein